MSRLSKSLIKDARVRADWVDTRDEPYRPSLSVLRDSVFLDERLVDRDKTTGIRVPVFGVRDQGASGRCVGHAMANLIDIQRNLRRLERRRIRNGPKSTATTNSSDTASGECAQNLDIGNCPSHDIASADMLYYMAYFHDHYPDLEDDREYGPEGVRTLRSAIKGFYHHGACRDWPEAAENKGRPERWQSNCYFEKGGDTLPFPTVDQAKDARNISLGAYYRLASVLNDFHAALNDAQAILVSANVHENWLVAGPKTKGKIELPPKAGLVGTHAFVITGYDEHGFHVLNSWGPEWGLYENQAGIALWDYEDWARNVIDAWVLRLGVKAPKAFGVSTGEKGTKGVFGSVRAGSTPGHQLVGHYMHLDDGFHVSQGSYPSFRRGWTGTHDYLSERRLNPTADPAEGEKNNIYRGLVIWIPGSFEGMKSAFDDAVARKAPIKALGLYPYSIFWCNDFVDKSLEVLDIVFESCVSQAGEGAAHLDTLIERTVRGVGRAFWRDIEMGAQHAVRGPDEHPNEAIGSADHKRLEPGFVTKLIAGVMQLKAETRCEVHLVAEGAGALVVHELLASIAADKQRTETKRHFPRHDSAGLFDTIHLVHPAIGVARAQRHLIPLFEEMNGGRENMEVRSIEPNTRDYPYVKGTDKRNPRHTARLYIPTERLEDCVKFGAYGKSILHLVSRSFEDRYVRPTGENAGDCPTQLGPARPFLGMADVAMAGSYPDGNGFPLRGAIYRLNRVATQKTDIEPVTQTELNRDQTIAESIFDTIADLRVSK